MNSDKDKAHHSSGTSRYKRFLPMLDRYYFKIDERSLADYLVFIEKYGAFVYSHSRGHISEKDQQTWRTFFSSDLSVFLAKLSVINIQDFLPFYLPADGLGGAQMNLLQKKLDVIIHFITVVNDSYKHVLRAHGHETEIQEFIDLIEQIKSEAYVNRIFKLGAQLHLTIDFEQIDKEALWTVWAAQEHFFIKPLIGKAQVQAVEDLNKVMNAFTGLSSQMLYSSRTLLLRSIESNQNHNPGQALFIAFLKLYEYVQRDLNDITGKHLDYFYKDILQQSPKPSAGDNVHVYCTLADHVKSYTIEKGTLFKAGTDEEGYDRLYMADDFLSVNKTKVTDLATVFLCRNSEVSVESSYAIVSGVYQSQILNSPKGGFDFTLAPQPYPLFGEEQANLQIKTMEPSSLGFAFASPILLLSEGRRACRLVLSFNIKSMASLLSFLERYTLNNNLAYDSAFDKLFGNAFQISLSTEEGWYKIEEYKVFPPNVREGSIELFFILEKGAPAIKPMGETWDKEERHNYGTEWPVMRVCLGHERSMYMYSYLKDLVLQDCSMSVEVLSVKNLEVYNDLGKLDTSNPFYPFGSLPVLGSSLLIGNEELYKKNIDDFSLELVWHNLPRDKGGFKTYYKEYYSNLENDDFKVGISALSDYEFHPKDKDKIQQFSLFAMEESQEGQIPVLANKTLMKGFDVNILGINGSFEKTDLLPYDNKAKLGYLKLELMGPEMCFGQSMYPSLLSSTFLKGLKTSQVHIPNLPYVPQLKSIALNYKASTKVSFLTTSATGTDPKAKEKFYMLQPYGIRTIFENSMATANHLFPQYDHDAYMLIGLDEVIQNEALTLYFMLDPNIGNDFEVELPEVQWFYVTDDRWVPFEKKDLVFDTTNKFTTSGIVKLQIPSQIDSENTVLPRGKYWIVAALRGDIRLAAKLRGLHTQALKLNWVSHKKGAEWVDHIQKSSIEGLLVARSEIAGVFQPLPSFGGRLQEVGLDFYTRVSERLRHRNRCITAWDYERMVLEHFPFVHQVKCLSPLDHPEDIPAGKVVIVVVPKSRLGEELVLPRFNYNILQEIQSFVQSYTAPQVRVQVVNPVYEEVRVSAALKFVDPSKQGIGIEQLHRDLRSFMCPWFHDIHRDMLFGGSVNVDEIDTFIGSKSYISFVTNVSLLVLHYHDKDYSLSDSMSVSQTDKTLYGSKPWAVLVPMKQHPFTIIDQEVYMTPEKVAIENLRLGSEFVLSEKKKKGTTTTTNETLTPDLAQEYGYVSVEIDL